MEPIAIIGLSCLFPGARTPQEFWHNLLAESETTSSITAAEMGVDPDTFFHPEKGQRDKFYSLRGGFVRDFQFNANDYQLPADFLSSLDSLFQWPLYVAREALRDSGYLESPVRAKTGVVLGNLSFPTRASHHLFAPIYQTALTSALRDLLKNEQFQLPRLDPPAQNSLANTLIAGYPAAVVSQALGLSSDHFALDAACASSLYAVKLACDYLHAGKADLMLAGAVSCADPFFIKMGFSIFQAYPTNDNSCPLDKTSQGLVSSEGAGMFVLKRLADAERDGDRIYAVLRGVGLSNDGKGKHLLTPNPKGQQLAFQRAYAEAGIGPQEIDYIECHATGTPLGDITELNSMENFFGATGAPAPLVGSVKSNFGHMLTAAGMGGMLKVILGMANSRIPATIKVKEPHASQNNRISAAQIVLQQREWPNGRGPVKRAAVSAFGFGGTNAHLVVEETASASAHQPTPKEKPATLAISGMAAHFGSCASLEELRRTLHAGEQLFGPIPAQRWKGLENQSELLKQYGIESAPKGAYISDFEMDFLHFKIPPNDADQPIPQQLLMLKVADSALQDAKIKPGSNVAVLIAMDAELALHEFRGRVDLTWQLPAALERAGIQITPELAAALQDSAKDSLHIPALVNQYTSFIGNIMASRIAALWDFSGPAFTLSSAENSVAKAMEIAQMLLSRGEVEAVLLGAVDLSGGIEHVLLRHQMSPLHDHSAQPTLGLSASNTGWLIGEGAGAIVLERADQAQQAYASIESMACAPATAEGVAQAASEALLAAGIRPTDIGYLEVNAGGFPYQDEAEISGLRQAYPSSEAVMGSVKTQIGHTFVAAGVASLIRTALCLSEHYLPGTPHWDQARQPLPFTVPEQAQPWLTARRVAAMNVLSHDHTCAHFVLSADETHKALPVPGEGKVRYRPNETLRLVPIAAADLAALQTQLKELEQAESLSLAAHAAWKNFQANPQAPVRVMLLARDAADLRNEAAQAQTGVPKAIESGKRWLTARGSCFIPNPLRGPVTFVYPGAFNSYSDLGSDLFSLFPGLYKRFTQITQNPVLAMRADKLYPRRQTRITEKDRQAIDQAMPNDPLTMVASGTSLSTLYTLVLREWFGMQPASALGYSLGEATMMWALGVWTNGDDAAKALRESALFNTRIAGPKHAIREAWKIDPSVPDEDLWCTYVLMTSPEKVQAALANEPRAFITIISAPDEVVLAGDPAACKRVIAQLGCHALRAPFDHAIHCPPMQSEFSEFEALHRWPVAQTTNVVCYSAAAYAPVELTSQAIAQSVSTVSTSQVDFPRLVRQVYQDGARIFVELGPHRTCSRWVDDILKGQDHLALNINQKGKSDQTSLLRLLAQLAAHHTPLDLSPLFDDAPAATAKAGFIKRIIPGGDRLADILLTDANRAAFANLPTRPASQPAFPATNIPAELEPLRRDWQTLMKQIDSPQVPQGITISMTETKSVAPVQASAAGYLTPGPQVLSPELLKQLENFRRESHAPAATPAPRNEKQPTPAPAVVAAPVEKKAKPEGVIWDKDDLLVYAEGNIADVFGPEYAIIDTYSRRVRLPMPPYLLVDRITKLDAKINEYKPSSMTTEYDIPLNAWYSVDGQVPWAVSVESGQCDLMLISFLGIDFQNKGHLVYRLLDCTLTFLDEMPKEGQTLRYDISINSFASSGDNLLFFFSYNCFVGDKMVLKMRGGCAGFFSDEDLARGKGVIFTDAELTARANAVKQQFAPLLTSARTTFGQEEMRALTRGDLTACFGPQYYQPGRNPSLRLPAGDMMMIDRVVDIQTDGGPWGLGLVTAEHDLAPENWYFPCHFKGDQVMAGSLMADGCVQLMQFYLLYLGFHTHTVDARFQPIQDLPQVVRCRGQVTPTTGKLIYRMEITKIGLEPTPHAIANIEIILNGKMIVHFKDLGLQLIEKNPAAPVTAKRTALYDERHIEEFALGSLAACFGPEYAHYDTRRAPRTPNGDLKLISRVLSINGTRGQVTAGSSLVTEYDVPADAWYFEQNAYPTLPYSVLMEIGLQPCGFLSAHLGSTLPFPEENFYFRNLDGSGKYLREVDTRGKTITNRVELTSSTHIPGIIMQKFKYELSYDGQPFYAGDAAFGYFQAEALVNQVGLDRGNSPAPLALGQAAPIKLNLRQPDLFRSAASQPHYKLSGGELHLLDEVQIIPGGGKAGQGYIYAYKKVNPQDWFFRAHFHQDPVMPGSLGVEAMLQAFQAYALQTGVGREFRSPRFAHTTSHNVVWKYRGQIVPNNKDMSLELHITKVETAPGCITLIADASLWKENLRIYELSGLALSVVEAG